MKLTDEERRSALWRKLSAHAESRLQSLRIQNDGDKDAAETAKLRGRIAEVKVFLALGEEPAPEERRE